MALVSRTSVRPLTSHLRSYFQSMIRLRGDEYFFAGRVKKTEIQGQEILFTIEGNETYHSRIYVAPGSREVGLSCDCPFFTANGGNCKHLWAAARSFDQKNLHKTFKVKGPVKVLLDYKVKSSFENLPEAHSSWQHKINELNKASSSAGPDNSLSEKKLDLTLLLDSESHKSILTLDILVNGKKRSQNPLALSQLAQVENPKLRGLLLEYFLSLHARKYYVPTHLNQIDILPPNQNILEELCNNNFLQSLSGKLYQFSADPVEIFYSLTQKGDHYIATPKIKIADQDFSLDDFKIYADSLLAISGSQIYKLAEPATPSLVKEILLSEDFEFDPSEVEDFIFSFQSQLSLRLKAPADLEWPTVIKKPKPQVVINLFGQSVFLGKISFIYGDQTVASTSTTTNIVNRSEKSIHPRQLETEKKIMQDLFSHYAIVRTDQTQASFEIPEKSLSWVIELLFNKGFDVLFDNQKVKKMSALSTETASGTDWLELSLKMKFDQQEVELPSLLQGLEHNNLITLSDGSLGFINPEWQKKVNQLLRFSKGEGSHLKLSPLQALLLSQSMPELNMDSKALSKKWKRLTEVESAMPGAEFKGDLRNYQQKGLGWLETLYDEHLGGILADDMGLGKTIQVLALLEKYKIKKTLIVAPKSLVFNWQSEAQKFTPSLKVYPYTAETRQDVKKLFKEYQVIVANYPMIRQDFDQFSQINYDLVILDEAQMIKNPKTLVSQAVKGLSSSHRLALTGTPVENSMADLFSIMDFVNPGLLAAGHKKETQDTEFLEGLVRGLKPFILRRKKEQVLTELPAKTEQVLYCELSEEEREEYNRLKAYYQRELKDKIGAMGFNRSKIVILEALLRLRQAACHQGLLNKKISYSSKFSLLLEQIEELQLEGHKCLVFSQFTSLLKLLEKELQSKKVSYLYLDGQTRNRQELVETFQATKEHQVFLLSLKAGGVGLNLTAADYVFLLDPWWNPAVEAQAIDRTHRIGQTNKVMAYRLIAKDTIEEKVLELQNKKRHLKDLVLSDDERLMKSLTEKDLEILLS